MHSTQYLLNSVYQMIRQKSNIIDTLPNIVVTCDTLENCIIFFSISCLLLLILLIYTGKRVTKKRAKGRMFNMSLHFCRLYTI